MRISLVLTGIFVLLMIALATSSYAPVSYVKPEPIISQDIEIPQEFSFEVSEVVSSRPVEPEPLDPGCPLDDTIITTDLTLSFEICNVDDDEDNGVLIIGSSNIVLDCNETTLIGSDRGYGIVNNGYSNVVIKNCNIKNYENGIWLWSANNNKLLNNNVTLNSWNNIRLEYSNNNTLQNNEISYSSTYQGIGIWNSFLNKIIGNVISNNNNNGIYLYGSGFNEIKNNLIENSLNYHGISIDINSDNNNVENNIIRYNNLSGVNLISAQYNSINGNEIYSNQDGVGLFNIGNDHNVVKNNVIHSNLFDGIIVYDTAAFHEIINNTIYNNSDGIYFYNTYVNKLFNNKIYSNKNFGITLAMSFDNTIECNSIYSNGDDGITLISDSYENIIRHNNLSLNSYGVSISSTLIHQNSVDHNNFIDNVHSPQASDPLTGENYWDDGTEGNYWSDYNGTDSNSDGIGDTPYVIDSDSQDNYPLMQPLPICEEDTIPPIAPVLQKAVLTGPSFENVEISWYASADEGLLGGTVRYIVGRFEGNFPPVVGEVAAEIAADGSSIYTFTDMGRGDWDSSNYFYDIRAVDEAGNTADSWYAGKFVNSLTAGEKFISIPLIQWNTSVEEVLKTLSFDKVRYYDVSDVNDHWKTYMTFKPYKGDLRNIDHKMGFWVNVLYEDNFTVAGLVPEYTEIPLYQGWNVVGYPSLIDRTVSEALSGVPWLKVEAYDDNPPYYLKELMSNDTMSPGNGYWIEVSNNTIWNVTNYDSGKRCKPEDQSKNWPTFHNTLDRVGFTNSKAPHSVNSEWLFPTPFRVIHPIVYNGVVYVAGTGPLIFAVNASTGEHIWNFSMGGDVRGSPAASHGLIFFGHFGGGLYALNATTGEEVWYFPLPGVESSPLIKDCVVYVGADDGQIHALDEKTGDEIWNFSTGASYVTSPTYYDEKIFIQTGGIVRKLYALTMNGSLIWEKEINGTSQYSSPAASDGLLYVATSDNNIMFDWFNGIHAYNVTNGDEVWNFELGQDYQNQVWTTPAVAYGKVFFGSKDNRTYALNKTNGEQIWNFTTGGWVDSSPAIADGLVFIGSSDSYFYALNESTGEMVWSYDTFGFIGSSPAIANGMVFVSPAFEGLRAFS